MKKKIAIETTLTVYVCDHCDSEEQADNFQGISLKTCLGCEAEICSSCRVQFDQDIWTGDRLGDYPEYLCSSCNVLLKPFAAEARKILEKTDQELEQLKKSWRTEIQQKKLKQKLNAVKE